MQTVSSSTISDLQRKIENDMISIIDYRNMTIEMENCKKRIDTEMVSLSEYNKLKSFLQATLNDKKLIEESVTIIEETKRNL